MYVPVKNGLKVTTLCITIEYSKGLGLYLALYYIHIWYILLSVDCVI